MVSEVWLVTLLHRLMQSTDDDDEVARILRDNGVTYTHDHSVRARLLRVRV